MSNIIHLVQNKNKAHRRITATSNIGQHYMKIEFVLSAAAHFSNCSENISKLHNLLDACLSVDKDTLICKLNEAQWAFYLEANGAR